MVFTQKKVFILISLLIVSLLILSGCGGSSNDSDSTSAAVKSMSTVESALQALENENTDALTNYAHDEVFRAEENGSTLTFDEFLNTFEQIFSTGAEFYKMELESSTTELITSDEVKITGIVLTSGLNENGESFQNESTPVEFRVRNFGGSWLITKFVFGSSSSEEITPGPMETTDNFINAIKQENLSSISRYVDSESFRYIYSTESNSLNINEFISLLEEAFSAGVMYEVLYLKNTTYGADAAYEVEITGTMEASGIDADGNYFESNRPTEIIVNKIEGTWLITKFVW